MCMYGDNSMVSLFDMYVFFCFFFSSRRRHTRFDCDWSSDVCFRSETLDRMNASEFLRSHGASPGAVALLGVGYLDFIGDRSEERRVGKECRSRWSPYH